MQEYRDARDAWERLRESGTIVTGIAGTAHSTTAAYQLSDAEFAEAFPPPLFRDWLIANGQNGARARDAGDAESVPYEQSETT